MNSQYLFFIFGGVAVLLFSVLGYFIYDLKKKWRTIFGKANTSNELLAEILKFCKTTEDLSVETEKRLSDLEAIGEKSVQKVGFIRFNPFSETGGDNSFALTLLDKENNGVIISSLYTRESVRAYGKRIESGKPKQPLSEEEASSLKQAMEGK